MQIFKNFESDDIVKANPAEISTGLWSGDTGSLATFLTSSVQSGSTSGQYYYDIYNLDPAADTTAEVQFAVAYGNLDGGGAPTLTEDDNALLPTKATYTQYRNILLDPSDTYFTFGVVDSSEIFVINIERARLRGKLDPGNWLLALAGGVTLIDDSGQTLGETYGTSGRVFNVVSGSLTGISGSTIFSTGSATYGTFGLVYPDVGLIVLNPAALADISAVGATDTANTTHKDNQQVLLTAITTGADFQARSAETISSTHYFVRMRNKEFNYSNNPSFFNETNGAILNTNFIQDPIVFVTTVGLYSGANELLAVAKLSQPLAKSFDREALIRVRLDF